MVPDTDLNVKSVLNYAVSHLKVKHVVVCGHYYCGGVIAAMQSADLGLLNPWIRNIRDLYHIHKAELDLNIDFNKVLENIMEIYHLEE